MSRVLSRLSLTAAVLVMAATAQAAEPAAPLGPIPGEWTVTLGVEGRVKPTFEGADTYEVLPAPLFSMRRIGTPRRFSAPRDSAGIAIIEGGGFHFGPVGKIRLGRDQDDDDALRGLGDVDWTFELGAFLEYWPVEWLRGRIEARRGFGGHEGWIGDFTADVVVPWNQWTFSAGPRLSVWSDEATSPYFSITPWQSISSGLPVYDAKGGLHSVGAGVQARYEWSPQWATHAYVEYEHLMGDAKDNPLVAERGSPDQFTFGLGVTYTFDVKLW